MEGKVIQYARRDAVQYARRCLKKSLDNSGAVCPAMGALAKSSV